MSGFEDRSVLELYGTRSCRYTAEMREDLLWEGRSFQEYDVEEDPAALRRMIALTGGHRLVPVLVQDGKIVQVGMHGRGCYVADDTGRGMQSD